MNTPSTENRSPRPHLHAQQYGLALVHQNKPVNGSAQGRTAQPTRSISQRAAILRTTSEGSRIIPREIGIHDLLTALGFGACDLALDAKRTLPCEEIRLDAGASLYEQGQHVGQAFILLEGILARQQVCNAKSTAVQGPSPIALSGKKELIGLHLGLSRRPERAWAVTKATVLALSIKALQALVPSSTLINDLLMRTAGAALFRDWRVAYRLRDLPAFARTVAGLSHIASLTGLKPVVAQADGTISLTLPLPSLASWLAMDMEALCVQIKRLKRYGVVSTYANDIVWLDPLKLEALWTLD